MREAKSNVSLQVLGLNVLIRRRCEISRIHLPTLSIEQLNNTDYFEKEVTVEGFGPDTRDIELNDEVVLGYNPNITPVFIKENENDLSKLKAAIESASKIKLLDESMSKLDNTKIIVDSYYLCPITYIYGYIRKSI